METKTFYYICMKKIKVLKNFKKTIIIFSALNLSNINLLINLSEKFNYLFKNKEES